GAALGGGHPAAAVPGGGRRQPGNGRGVPRGPKSPCFVKFSEVEKMANMRAEINEVQPLLLSPYCKAV
uniref:Uncharacterized protein n=1 Tax=Strix occidentalis caurina TaxID=311401 RepID=A0A8D0KVP6_STROC